MYLGVGQTPFSACACKRQTTKHKKLKIMTEKEEERNDNKRDL